MSANVLLPLTLLSLVCVLVQGDDGVSLASGGRPYKANFTISLKEFFGSKIESMMEKPYINGTDAWFYSDVFSTETDPEIQWQLGIAHLNLILVLLKVWNFPSNITSIRGLVETGFLDANGKKVPHRDESFSVSREVVASFFTNMRYKNLPDNPDPQFRVYYDIDAVLNYEPNATVDAANLGNEAEKHDLVQRKRPYWANFTVSLFDVVGSSIESMLNSTYKGTETSFKSKILATKLEPDVQWYFRVQYNKEVSNLVKIYLHLSSLPEDIKKVSARLRCHQVLYAGAKLSLMNSPERESLITGSHFKAHYVDRKSINKRLLDPKYRISCDIFEGFLIYKNVSKVLLEAKDEVLEAKDNVIKMEVEVLKTRDEIVKVKKEVLNAKDEVLKLKEDLLETKAEVLKMRDNVTKTEEKVLETKSELLEMKDELVHTKDEVVKSKDDVMKAKEEVEKTKDEMAKMKDKILNMKNELVKMNETRSLHCRKELARDTLKVLSNKTVKVDFELKSSYKSFKLHSMTIKLHSVILTSRMPSFNLSGTVHDFSDELEPEQLEALVNFVYWGIMKKWSENCQTLVRVAGKYAFECLLRTCEDVLVNQMKDISEDVKSNSYY